MEKHDPEKAAKDENAAREAERIAQGGEMPSERAMRLAAEQRKCEVLWIGHWYPAEILERKGVKVRVRFATKRTNEVREKWVNVKRTRGV